MLPARKDCNHNQFSPTMTKGHEYEELPGLSRYTPVGQPIPDEQLSGSSSVTVAKDNFSNGNAQKFRSSDSIDTFQTDNMTYRKKQNPLYDALSGVEDDAIAQRLYSDNVHTNNTPRCLCLIILMLGALTLALLVLVLLILFGVLMPGIANGGPQSDTYSGSADPEIAKQTALDKLSQLEDKYSLLQAQMKRMNETYVRHVESMQSMFIDHLAEVQKQVANISTGFSNQVSAINYRLVNISKIPGPRGPKGAGDLSQCRYRYIQQGSPILDAQTKTNSVPDGSGRNWIITGLACSTKGGLEATLTNSLGPTFRCVCSGKAVGAGDSRDCYMHIWECPRDS